MNQPRHSERGSVLVLGLLILLVLMGASASFLSLSMYRNASARAIQDGEFSTLVAEAGIDHALYEVREGMDTGTDGIGVVTGVLNGIEYDVTISPAFGTASEYTLRAIAARNQIQRGVEIVVGTSGLEVGFVGLDSISMSGGSIFDSYDSSAGTYASQVGALGYAGTNGDVASNGDISVGGAAVWGNATPGPGGSVLGDTSLVYGSTAPATEPVTFDPYTYSPPIPVSGAWSGTGTITGGTYHFSQFVVSGGKTVTFQGDVVLYVDDKFNISGSGVGLMDPGATLEIHHGGGDFKLSGSGVINQDLLPGNLTVHSATTKKFEISGGAQFYGVAFAPEAQFVSSGGSQLFGAITAKSMSLSGSASLHFDEALNGGGGGGVQVLMGRAFRP